MASAIKPPASCSVVLLQGVICKVDSTAGGTQPLGVQYFLES
jgi:hypothetical protein